MKRALNSKKVTLNALNINLPLKHNQNPRTRPPTVSYTQQKSANKPYPKKRMINWCVIQCDKYLESKYVKMRLRH